MSTVLVKEFWRKKPRKVNLEQSRWERIKAWTVSFLITKVTIPVAVLSMFYVGLQILNHEKRTNPHIAGYFTNQVIENAQAKEVKPLIATSTPTESEYELVVKELLSRIAYCESQGTHTDSKGRVVRGRVDRNDIGLYQINLVHNGELAASLGYNVFNKADNEAIALELLKRRGTQPWDSSKPCWWRE